MAQFATVVAITGNGTVFAVNAQGESRVLKAGDTLQKGEIIRTVGDARVELMMDDGQLLAVAPDQSILLDENVAESDLRPTAQDSALAAQDSADAIIQALERGTDLNETLEAPAAGVAGDGGADGGSSFVQLLRIVEGVEPLAYAYSFEPEDSLFVPENFALEQPVTETFTVTVTGEVTSTALGVVTDTVTGIVTDTVTGVVTDTITSEQTNTITGLVETVTIGTETVSGTTLTPTVTEGTQTVTVATETATVTQGTETVSGTTTTPTVTEGTQTVTVATETVTVTTTTEFTTSGSQITA
ncbi:MAG: retention module-containing protein, partial [Thiobacillus sp.]